MPLDETDRLPPVAGLLRRPAVVVRHEVMASLHAAGFGDVLPGHLAVFQHPGPDGQRPGVLAARTEASKQAMNHLLHQLEEGGYLVREQRSGDQRTRVVRLTEQGRRVDAVIRQTLLEVDDEWRQALGDEQHARLSRGLQQLHDLLEARLPSSR
jgi:DNA-binding MarR family transcriptional regulator